MHIYKTFVLLLRKFELLTKFVFSLFITRFTKELSFCECVCVCIKLVSLMLFTCILCLLFRQYIIVLIFYIHICILPLLTLSAQEFLISQQTT